MCVCAHQHTEKNNRRRWRGLALPCHYDHFGLRGADLYGSEAPQGGGGGLWKKSPANPSYEKKLRKFVTFELTKVY